MTQFSNEHLSRLRRYQRVRVGQLAAPAGLSPDRLKLLRTSVPAIDCPPSRMPFTQFGIHLLLNRLPIPVIEEGKYFRPIGGLRLLALTACLAPMERIVVDVWDAQVLKQHPKFSLQEALLTSLMYGLDLRSSQDQLRRLHAALGKEGCDEVFENAASRAEFEAVFGVNRRGSLAMPETPVLNLAQEGLLEGASNE